MPEGAYFPELVVEHEFGHQYWYGMVATNEFEDAWMDEGINSYYEYRYLKRKYPSRKMSDEYISYKLAKFFDVYQYSLKYFMDLGYQFLDDIANIDPNGYRDHLISLRFDLKI